MSRQGGRKPGRGASKASQRPSGPAAARRLGLLVFGAVFLVLFAVVAIGEGLGDPSIPSGDVVLVEDAPGASGEISKADFDHALELAAAAEGQKKVPKAGSAKYDELKETALTSLLESAWLEGQGEEMGITVSDAEVAKEFKKLKKENFPTEAEYQKFLKESKFTPEDIDTRVKLQVLSTEIQEQLKEDPPTPSQREIENYYEAAKATQFTKPPSRDVRLIVNKEEEKAQKALTALESGNTAKDWSRVAKEFSEDAATKEKGGLQKGIPEGGLQEPVGAAIFDAVEGQLEGPIKAPVGFYVFEVQSSEDETVEPLEKVEGQISSQLAQQLEQQDFSAFVSSFNARWTSRTFCAEDYVIERCANFESDGRPAGAPPACYEEDPDGGRPEACPAPVFQLVPALPGSVTPLAPQGNPLAQRPVPAGEPQPAGEEGATGLPPGAVPPPSE
ncbi:MAG TPA: peptidyl-prolyl cis-trans isomerase [Solirubrobacterales bacterium]|nr:peptidyl-prolyl cis-trans isomerase [Solirubrobacterales bacterium]